MRSRCVTLLSAAVLIGCTEHAAVPADTTALFMTQERLDPRAYALQRNQAEASLDEVVVASAAFPAIPRPDSSSSMVIRTATASIEVASLETAVSQLTQLAARLGGYVANSGIEVGRSRLRQAIIQVKIPAPRFEEVLSGLRPIGKLESVNVSAQDVGEEYVDVNARMENARRLERRLIDLLASRTGKLKDVLDVEQALARVREEIERYEGRVRYLRAHTATSTLSVTVHEPLPIVTAAGRGPISEAFRQAWRNVVLLISFAVQSMGVVIPLAVVALVAWSLVRRSRRVINQGAA